MDGYFQIEKKQERGKGGGEQRRGGVGEGQVDETGGDKRM